MPNVSVSIGGQDTVAREVTRLLRTQLAMSYRVEPAEVTVVFGPIQPARLGRPCDVTLAITISEDVRWPRPESRLLLQQLAAITDPSSGNTLGSHSIGLYSNNAEPVYHFPAEIGAK